MENEQSSASQNPMETQARSQQNGLNNSKIFAIVVVSVLLTAIIAGSSVYFWQRSVSNSVIISLEQKITSLEKQVSTMKKVETTPQPTSPPVTSPTPITDATAGWKTYTNDELYFKYPSHWTLEESGVRILGIDPDVVIYAVTKNSTLMNECMKRDVTQEREGLVIRKYSRVTTGAMCSTGDSSRREIWVIPTEDTYSPGISYSYSAEDNPEAENIFNQILSTFKFTD